MGNEGAGCSAADTNKWRMQYIGKYWLCINEKILYRKTINCINKTHILNLGEYN
jgi:hypothetical protein